MLCFVKYSHASVIGYDRDDVRCHTKTANTLDLLADAMPETVCGSVGSGVLLL